MERVENADRWKGAGSRAGLDGQGHRKGDHHRLGRGQGVPQGGEMLAQGATLTQLTIFPLLTMKGTQPLDEEEKEKQEKGYAPSHGPQGWGNPRQEENRFFLWNKKCADHSTPRGQPAAGGRESPHCRHSLRLSGNRSYLFNSLATRGAWSRPPKGRGSPSRGVR